MPTLPHPATIAAALTTTPPPGDTAETIESVFSLVEALPNHAHAAVGVLLIAGIALWLFGGRVIKPLFAIIGLGFGGLIGLMIVPAFGIAEIAGAPASIVGMAIGAGIGLIIALVMLKVALVLAAGLGFALVGFLGATIYLQHNQLPSQTPPAPIIEREADRSPTGRLLFDNPYTGEKLTIEQLTRTLREAEIYLRSDDQAPDPAANNTNHRRAQLEGIALRCRAVLAEALDAATRRINALSVRERVLVFGSTLGMLAIGMLVGYLLPKRTTAVITALAGSAIWLAAAAWLIDALAPRFSPATDHSPQVWAVIWGGVFLVGLVVQLAGLGRPTDRPKPQPNEDE